MSHPLADAMYDHDQEQGQLHAKQEQDEANQNPPLDTDSTPLNQDELIKDLHDNFAHDENGWLICKPEYLSEYITQQLNQARRSGYSLGNMAKNHYRKPKPIVHNYTCEICKEVKEEVSNLEPVAQLSKEQE